MQKCFDYANLEYGGDKTFNIKVIKIINIVYQCINEFDTLGKHQTHLWVLLEDELTCLWGLLCCSYLAKKLVV